ncbi:MAG TPA: hypothetical protein VLE69_01455 [Candidatus Saccharimonadales bacterium]|nr:hypothetical protein [Candidatus Saccharimonadales bacterium]
MSTSGGTYEPEFVREVEPIFMGCAIPGDRESLAFVVEAPLIEPCQDLFDKNIRSVISSANVNDIRTGFAYITLDCSTMSDENLIVVDEMKLETAPIQLPAGGELLVGLLTLPIKYDTKVQELSRKALESTGLFKLQPKLWG